MEGVDMKPRAWNKTIKVLKVCHLYIPGSYKWRDSLKKYRITMFVLRALGTAWTGLAAFGSHHCYLLAHVQSAEYSDTGVGKSSGTLDVYKMVARYAVLRAPPYSPPIYHTLLVSTVWVSACFCRSARTLLYADTITEYTGLYVEFALLLPHHTSSMALSIERFRRDHLSHPSFQSSPDVQVHTHLQ